MENLLDRCPRCGKRSLYSTMRIERRVHQGHDLGWSTKYKIWRHFFRTCKIIGVPIFDDDEEGLTEK